MMNFKRIMRITLLVGLILFVTGCSANSEAESGSKDKNISSLEHVLKNTFTGPNPELNELLADPENATILGQEAGNTNSKEPTELNLFLQEMYQSNFTTDMYDQYIGTYALSYYSFEKQQEIDSIDIQQKDTNENTYDFTANVRYHQDENQAQEYKVTGQASFSKEGKISGLKFLSDEGLSEALQDN